MGLEKRGKYRPSRRAQGSFTVSFLALSPVQIERNLAGIQLARQSLNKSQKPSQSLESVNR